MKKKVMGLTLVLIILATLTINVFATSHGTEGGNVTKPLSLESSLSTGTTRLNSTNTTDITNTTAGSSTTGTTSLNVTPITAPVGSTSTSTTTNTNTSLKTNVGKGGDKLPEAGLPSGMMFALAGIVVLAIVLYNKVVKYNID